MSVEVGLVVLVGFCASVFLAWLRSGEVES